MPNTAAVVARFRGGGFGNTVSHSGHTALWETLVYGDIG